MKFIMPTEGKITSHYGKDVLQGKVRNHYGVDIAKSGTVYIHAVADGIVSKSYSSTSYGEVIFIQHKIDGQKWESVYAHMRTGSRKFSVGDKVKQGAVIGRMGNTGYSTGQHLHFELHKGIWNYGKTNSVNPLDYIGKELNPHISGIQVLGHIKIGGTRTGKAYICDKPSSTKSKNLATVKDGTILPISGSIVGWYEVIWNDKRAYVNAKFGSRV
jgi:hypothetical protein